MIASTLENLPPDSQLELDEQFFRLSNGQKHSGIAVFNGHYYAVGASISGGYREYKGEDDHYHNDVVALVFAPLGEKLHEERRGSREAWVLGCTALALAAFGVTGLRAAHRLADALPADLQGRDIVVTGLVASLPETSLETSSTTRCRSRPRR